MLLRLVLSWVVLLVIAVILVIRQPDLPVLTIATTVLVPIIFVVQLIVGWLCLHNGDQPPAVTDDSSEC